MAKRDYYEDICKYWEFILGEIPYRNELKETLKKIVAAEDLQIFFLLPLLGNITLTKLKKKAKMPPDELREKLKRLASEGFVVAYKIKNDYAYERSGDVYMFEQQVRKKEDTPQRTFFAKFFNTLAIEAEMGDAGLNKTPLYRVLPAEPAIMKSTELRTIDINVMVPDPRGVLPIDIITEMIRKDDSLIGIAECFCRKTKKILGESRDHPLHYDFAPFSGLPRDTKRKNSDFLETCLVFNEQAQTLIEHGFARKIDYNEAIQILKDCEARGFIHNVDNCEGQIRVLCNCCSCCCAPIKSLIRGKTNILAPSRYVVDFDAEKCENCRTCVSRCLIGARSIVYDKVATDTDRCIGCGLCVTTCPAAASKIVLLRKKAGKFSRSYAELRKKIGMEALVSLVKRKISEKMAGLIPKRSWYKSRR